MALWVNRGGKWLEWSCQGSWGLPVGAKSSHCGENTASSVIFYTHTFIVRYPSSPLIAFGHLSLYIQKHLIQSVAVCGDTCISDVVIFFKDTFGVVDVRTSGRQESWTNFESYTFSSFEIWLSIKSDVKNNFGKSTIAPIADLNYLPETLQSCVFQNRNWNLRILDMEIWRRYTSFSELPWKLDWSWRSPEWPPY